MTFIDVDIGQAFRFMGETAPDKAVYIKTAPDRCRRAGVAMQWHVTAPETKEIEIVR